VTEVAVALHVPDNDPGRIREALEGLAPAEASESVVA
jgi:hypothetical protein